MFTDGLADDRNDAHGGRLLIDHTDGALVGNDAGNGRGGGVTGNGNHVEAHRADAGHGLELLDVQGSGFDSVDHALILADGDEGTRETTYIGAGHDAAFLHLVVEHSQSGCGSGSTRLLYADAFENIGYGVAYGRCRGQREVDDAEGNIQSTAGFLGNELSDARNLERRLLDGLAEALEVGGGVLIILVNLHLLIHLLEGVFHYAGARDTDVDDGVGLAHAVEGAGHEGVVVGGIAEYDELRRTDALLVFGGFGRILHDVAHQPDGIHVDAGLGGAHVDAGANHVGSGECLGNGADEQLIAARHALADDG